MYKKKEEIKHTQEEKKTTGINHLSAKEKKKLCQTVPLA